MASTSVTTASTGYDAASNTWTTYQMLTLGATSLSTISFITASATQLPANAQVRSRPARGTSQLTGVGTVDQSYQSEGTSRTV